MLRTNTTRPAAVIRNLHHRDDDRIWLGRCLACKAPHRITAAPDRIPDVWCSCRADHGHPLTGIRWQTIKGTTNATKCNRRCEDSTSNICNCSCGGRNHGATYQVAL